MRTHAFPEIQSTKAPSPLGGRDRCWCWWGRLASGIGNSFLLEIVEDGGRARGRLCRPCRSVDDVGHSILGKTGDHIAWTPGPWTWLARAGSDLLDASELIEMMKGLFVAADRPVGRQELCSVAR
nr:hypothetical protein CFP56_73025 [Quercus suber]